VPPAVGHIAATPSLALLIKVYWAIQYGMSYVSALAFSNFSFFLQEHCGNWGLFWRAIMWPQDFVLLDMPSSNSHSLSALGDFWEGDHAASGCCSIGYASSHSHFPVSTWGLSGRAIMWPHDVVLLDMPLVTPLPLYFGLVCFFPSHPPFTYPFHTTRSAVLRSHSST